MPVPIPGSKVGSDNQKIKFLTIFGRPKTRFFDQISGVPGRAPLATNHAGILHNPTRLPPVPSSHALDTALAGRVRKHSVCASPRACVSQADPPS